MACDLIDRVVGTLVNNLAARSSQLLGEDEGALSEALRLLGPALIGGMVQSGSSTEGAEKLLGVIRSTPFSTGLGDDLSGVIKRRQALGQAAQRDSLGDHVFRKHLPGVVDHLAERFALKPASVAHLIEISLVVTFSVLRSRALDDTSGPVHLARILGRQGGDVGGKLDARLARIIAFPLPASRSADVEEAKLPLPPRTAAPRSGPARSLAELLAAQSGTPAAPAVAPPVQAPRAGTSPAATGAPAPATALPKPPAGTDIPLTFELAAIDDEGDAGAASAATRTGRNGTGRRRAPRKAPPRRDDRFGWEMVSATPPAEPDEEPRPSRTSGRPSSIELLQQKLGQAGGAGTLASQFVSPPRRTDGPGAATNGTGTTIRTEGASGRAAEASRPRPKPVAASRTETAVGIAPPAAVTAAAPAPAAPPASLQKRIDAIARATAPDDDDDVDGDGGHTDDMPQALALGPSLQIIVPGPAVSESPAVTPAPGSTPPRGPGGGAPSPTPGPRTPPAGKGGSGNADRVTLPFESVTRKAIEPQAFPEPRAFPEPQAFPSAGSAAMLAPPAKMPAPRTNDASERAPEPVAPAPRIAAPPVMAAPVPAPWAFPIAPWTFPTADSPVATARIAAEAAAATGAEPPAALAADPFPMVELPVAALEDPRVADHAPSISEVAFDAPHGIEHVIHPGGVAAEAHAVASWAVAPSPANGLTTPSTGWPFRPLVVDEPRHAPAVEASACTPSADWPFPAPLEDEQTLVAAAVTEASSSVYLDAAVPQGASSQAWAWRDPAAAAGAPALAFATNGVGTMPAGVESRRDSAGGDAGAVTVRSGLPGADAADGSMIIPAQAAGSTTGATLNTVMPVYAPKPAGGRPISRWWLAPTLVAVVVIALFIKDYRGAMERRADPTPDAAKPVVTMLKQIELPGGRTVEAPDSGLVANLASYLGQIDQQAGRTLVMEGIEFERETAVLTPRSEDQLRQVAQVMQAYPKVKIRIDAHVDSGFSGGNARQVTTERAATVKAGLILLGVEEGRVQSRGIAAERPIAKGDAPEARARNRRVDLTVVER